MSKVWGYIKKLQLSWTIWFGYLLIVLPMLQAQWDLFGKIFPEAVRQNAFMYIGLVVILLRAKTLLQAQGK